MNQKTMKSRTVLSRMVALLAVPLLFTSTAFAQGKQDFTLHNETGKEVKELYIGPHSDDEWGEDVLTDDTLETGDAVEISFDPEEEADSWDIKVVFRDGKEAVWTKLILTNITDITLSYKAGKPWATWKKIK